MKKIISAILMALVLLVSSPVNAQSPSPSYNEAEIAYAHAVDLLSASNQVLAVTNQTDWMHDKAMAQKMDDDLLAAIDNLSRAKVYDCFSEWWGLQYGGYWALHGIFENIVAEGFQETFHNTLLKVALYLIKQADLTKVDCSSEPAPSNAA